MRMPWKRNPKNRGQYLECGDFDISYVTGGLLADDNGKGETALIDIRDDGRTYYILNGDWRKDYDKIADQGYDACKAFYDSKKAEHRSRWSEDGNAEVTPEEANIVLDSYLQNRLT